MFKKIEEEISKTCLECKKECEKNNCPIYKIKLIVFSFVDNKEINIDDFFETSNENQITIYDINGENEEKEEMII